MTGLCYEIVSYSVSDEAQAKTARERAHTLLRSYPGFVAWTTFEGLGGTGRRTDVVAWTDHDSAKAAAKAVGTAPEFADFRESVAELAGMDHYRTSPTEAQPIGIGSGLELGRFRLKTGVNEATMRAAYEAMIAGFLASRPGWRRQHLVKLQDGTFVDLAFAQGQDDAESICASWADNVECDRLLAMIEPVSIEFGTVISA